MIFLATPTSRGRKRNLDQGLGRIFPDRGIRSWTFRLPSQVSNHSHKIGTGGSVIIGKGALLECLVRLFQLSEGSHQILKVVGSLLLEDVDHRNTATKTLDIPVGLLTSNDSVSDASYRKRMMIW